MKNLVLVNEIFLLDYFLLLKFKKKIYANILYKFASCVIIKFFIS